MPLTAPARLNLLLPWINGESLPKELVRQRVMSFLHDFVGQNLSAKTYDSMWTAYHATAAEFEATRRKVRRLMEAGFPDSGGESRYLKETEDRRGRPAFIPVGDRSGLENIGFDDMLLPLSCPSLRFGIKPHAKHEASELFVEGGRLQDLVGFLVLHLLTAGQTVVARCDAPAPAAWHERCGRFYVWVGRGRPRSFCSDECRTRHFDKLRYEKELEQQRAEHKRTRRSGGDGAAQRQPK